MNTIRGLVAGTLAAALLAWTAPADAQPYSEDGRMGAYLVSVRHCAGEYAVYDVVLRNDTHKAKRFRAFEVQRGWKISDRTHRVPRRTRTGLLFYVLPGEVHWVTVIHRGEVLLHRKLVGICY